MIYTTYFGKCAALKKIRPNAALVSIAGWTPDWFTKSGGLQYKKLAPKYTWWKEWHDTFEHDLESEESKTWYTEKYNSTVLSALDPHLVKCDLYNLANKRDVFILCYETPEKFCHRHLVADWLKSAGIKTAEWDQNAIEEDMEQCKNREAIERIIKDSTSTWTEKLSRIQKKTGCGLSGFSVRPDFNADGVLSKEASTERIAEELCLSILAIYDPDSADVEDVTEKVLNGDY